MEKKADAWVLCVNECEREEEDGSLIHMDIRYPPAVGPNRL